VHHNATSIGPHARSVPLLIPYFGEVLGAFPDSIACSPRRFRRTFATFSGHVCGGFRSRSREIRWTFPVHGRVVPWRFSVRGREVPWKLRGRTCHGTSWRIFVGSSITSSPKFVGSPQRTSILPSGTSRRFPSIVRQRRRKPRGGAFERERVSSRGHCHFGAPIGGTDPTEAPSPCRWSAEIRPLRHHEGLMQGTF